MSKSANRREARQQRPVDHRFGRIVYRQRNRFGYTQPDLSRITGVPLGRIKTIENSHDDVLDDPRLHDVAAIADELDIPIDEVVLDIYRTPRRPTRAVDRDSISHAFGTRLKAARETNGLTRSELSHETARERLEFISTSALNDIEKGRRSLTIDQAVTLAALLDRSVEDFLPRQRITRLDGGSTVEYIVSITPAPDTYSALPTPPTTESVPDPTPAPGLTVQEQLDEHRRALEGEELDVKQRKAIIARLERQLEQG